MDTISLLVEIDVLKKQMEKAEEFLEELIEYLLVTCKDDDYITPETICRKLAKYGYLELENGYWVNPLADRKIEPQPNADQHVQSVEPTWTKEEHEAFYTFLWNVINPNEMQDYIGMFETKDVPQMERRE